MQEKNEQAAERRVQAAKKAIMELGPMRPGLLTVQYRDRAHRRGAQAAELHVAAAQPLGARAGRRTRALRIEFGGDATSP